MNQALLRNASSLYFPLFRSSPPPCASCVRRRNLSATAPVSVFRPQEPYEYPKPRLDALGKPIRSGRGVIEESAEKDPSWDKRVKEGGKQDPIEQMLADMAEPTRKGFYERYGAHDGYGLRNKQRWRMGEDGKLELWDGAGANWKETLGFRPNMPRPGRRVEVPGFQHRKSPKIEMDARGRYVQVEGASWGVKAIGDGAGWRGAARGGRGDGGDRDRLEETEDGHVRDSGEGQRALSRWSDERPSTQQTKREWTGEADFLRADDDLVEPYHHTRRQDLPRALPPHLEREGNGDTDHHDAHSGRPRATPTASRQSAVSDPDFFDGVDRARPRFEDRPGPDGRPPQSTRSSFDDRISSDRLSDRAPLVRLPNASKADIDGYQTRSARASRLPRSSPKTFGARHYSSDSGQSGQGFAPPRPTRPTRPGHRAPVAPSAPSVSEARPAAIKVEGDEGPAPLSASQTPATYNRKHPGGWAPTKKLTYAAMAGLRELHAIDPKQYDKFFLAKKFGIHQESVRRILKSKWRERGGENITHTEGKPATKVHGPAGGGVETENKSLRGTKWDVSPDTAREASPVHALKQVRR